MPVRTRFSCGSAQIFLVCSILCAPEPALSLAKGVLRGELLNTLSAGLYPFVCDKRGVCARDFRWFLFGLPGGEAPQGFSGRPGKLRKSPRNLSGRRVFPEDFRSFSEYPDGSPLRLHLRQEAVGMSDKSRGRIGPLTDACLNEARM